MSTVPTASAERRADRRARVDGEPAETPLLDQIEAERQAIANREDLAARRDATDAKKIEAAQAILASAKVEELAAAQTKVESIMTEYTEAYDAAITLRREVEGARSTLTSFGADPAPIPPPLYLRATVGGDFALRQSMDAFRLVAIVCGEV